MALHTIPQFARLCGKRLSGVCNYIDRGKLIKSGDYLDDQIPANKAYLEKWKIDESLIVEAVKKLPVPKPAKPAKPIKPPKPEKIVKGKQYAPPVFPEPKPSNRKYEEPDASSTSAYSLDQQKKMVEIAYKESQTRKSLLEEAKLRGLNIPTDLVTGLFLAMGRQFQTSYNNGASQFLTDFCHRTKVSVEIKSELKGKLTKLINDSHRVAIAEMKRSIKNIIENSSIINESEQDDE